MALQVFYNTLSQPSRAILLFLKLNKIPYEDRPVDLAKGEQFSEEFSKVNPFSKIPAIVDGSFALTESVGILRYLSRERNVPDHWYPSESKAQAKVDEYLEWQHLNTRFHCASYFQLKWLMPAITGKPPKPEKVEQMENLMIQTLDNIEEIWLNNKNYLTGDKVSIADLLGACEIEQTRLTGFNALEGRPKMTAWLKRLQQELNPHYDEVHGKIYHLAKKYEDGLPIPKKD